MHRQYKGVDLDGGDITIFINHGGIGLLGTLQYYIIQVLSKTKFSSLYLTPNNIDEFRDIKILINSSAPLGVLADAIDENDDLVNRSDQNINYGMPKCWLTERLRLDNLREIKWENENVVERN